MSANRCRLQIDIEDACIGVGRSVMAYVVIDDVKYLDNIWVSVWRSVYITACNNVESTLRES